jgi:hypothetical protein
MYPSREYRTAAFHGPKTKIEGQETLWYWIFTTRHDNPDVGTVSSYEQAVSCAMSTPIKQKISAHEAIALLEKLENDARNSTDFTLANDRHYETYKSLKYKYHECRPFREHPTYLREQLQKKLKDGASQKSGLKLQPRKRNMGGPS